VVIEAPSACSCCGSDRLVKMGEDITETLEVIPRQWKVIQTVREKFTCRACEKISQPPAPFHATPRGWAGPNLLATILFEKFGQHQPLNRQAERYAREGVDLSLSTLADQVGACAAALEPLHLLIREHVMGAERLHGDDTTVPLLAKGGTKTARLWTYVRDDRPFAGGVPPAALFYFSRDREMAHHPNRHLTGWQGVLQADAYGVYNDLYRGHRDPGPVTSALCWSHARRKFFELADIKEKARRGSRPTTSRPWPWRRLPGSMLSSTWSAASLEWRPWRGSKRGNAWSGRWSTSSKTGCAPSGARCPGTTPSPRRSPTCSKRIAGKPSPDSSRMAGSA
jgi:transposase